jgi:signal peptidase II
MPEVPGKGGAPARLLGRALRRLLLFALGTLALDLITKFLIVGLLPLHAPIGIAGDVIRLVHVKNYGSAFGLVQGGRFFFIAFSILSILLIAALARLPRYRTPAYGLSLGLILGGATGNLLDRVFFGAVTDFIDVGIGLRRWPTFNVADIGVSVGVFLLAILLLREREPHAGGTTDSAPPAIGAGSDRARVGPVNGEAGAAAARENTREGDADAADR